MPLDAAVWEPISGKIFGVRGQWIYRFDAQGNKEAELRFYSAAIGRSEIATLNGFLYCAPVNFEKLLWCDGLAASPDRDVFRVDSNLTGSTPLGLYLNLVPTCGFFGILASWQALIPVKGAVNKIFAADYDDGFWSFTNPADPVRLSSGYGTGMDYDEVNNMIWLTDPQSPNIYVLETAMFLGASVFNAAPNLQPYWIAYAANVNAAYAVLSSQYVANGNQKLAKVDGAAAVNCLRVTGLQFPWTAIDTGVANLNPTRIRYCSFGAQNPYSGKLLIPGWPSDSIVVFNPLTDTVSTVKTGFNSPIDVVFTPTSAFAVQTAAVGLQEIL